MTRTLDADEWIVRDLVGTARLVAGEPDVVPATEIVLGDPPAGMSWGRLEGCRVFRAADVVDSPELRECLVRHGAGDWGEHGRLEDVELNADHRFAPFLFSMGVQNAVACEQRAGPIISRWPVEGLEIVSFEAGRDKRVYVRRLT
jgi:hypothetical protein